MILREALRLRRLRNMERSRQMDLEPAAGEDTELIAQLEDAARQLSVEQEQLRSALTRQKAEFDNFRRRVNKEKEQLRDSTAASIYTALLPILDNFERALEAAANATDVKTLRDGIAMVAGQLLQTLQQGGVQKMDALKAVFDPTQHEALSVEERSDVPENHITQVLLPGYRFRDKVIRAAMVKVAKAPASEPNPQATEAET
jgi:molecular chaperone GrpE